MRMPMRRRERGLRGSRRVTLAAGVRYEPPGPRFESPGSGRPESGGPEAARGAGAAAAAGGSSNRRLLHAAQ
jgi:hypothetical protein